MQLQTQLVLQHEASLPKSLHTGVFNNNRDSVQEVTDYNEMNVNEGSSVPLIEPRYGQGLSQKIVALEMPTIPEKINL